MEEEKRLKEEEDQRMKDYLEKHKCEVCDESLFGSMQDEKDCQMDVVKLHICGCELHRGCLSGYIRTVIE